LASNDEKHQFGLNIPYNMYHNIFDEHLWFSVFSRFPASSFTRVQRCTCCFVLLFTGMLLDILYYDQTLEAENTKELNGLFIGPFYVSREQVWSLFSLDIINDFELDWHRNNH
jgi:polycystin 1L2